MAVYPAMTVLNEALTLYINLKAESEDVIAEFAETAELFFGEGTLALALKWIEDDIDVLRHRLVYQQAGQPGATKRIEIFWRQESLSMNREFNRGLDTDAFPAMEARALRVVQSTGLTKARLVGLLWESMKVREGFIAPEEYYREKINEFDRAFRGILHKTRGEGLPFLIE